MGWDRRRRDRVHQRYLMDALEVRYTQGERRSIVESKVSVSDWGPYAHADA